MVEVCAVISDVPDGGLECPVVASLSAADGNKAGECWCLDFCSTALIMKCIGRLLSVFRDVEVLPKCL